MFLTLAASYTVEFYPLKNGFFANIVLNYYHNENLWGGKLIICQYYTWTYVCWILAVETCHMLFHTWIQSSHHTGLIRNDDNSKKIILVYQSVLMANSNQFTAIVAKYLNIFLMPQCYTLYLTPYKPSSPFPHLPPHHTVLCNTAVVSRSLYTSTETTIRNSTSITTMAVTKSRSM